MESFSLKMMCYLFSAGMNEGAKYFQPWFSTISEVFRMDQVSASSSQGIVTSLGSLVQEQVVFEHNPTQGGAIHDNNVHAGQDGDFYRNASEAAILQAIQSTLVGDTLASSGSTVVSSSSEGDQQQLASEQEKPQTSNGNADAILALVNALGGNLNNTATQMLMVR